MTSEAKTPKQAAEAVIRLLSPGSQSAYRMRALLIAYATLPHAVAELVERVLKNELGSPEERANLANALNASVPGGETNE